MFYEIEITRNMEDVESKGMYSYSTRDEAVKAFHTKMASGLNQAIAGTVKYVLNMVINDYGNTVMMERWTAPEPEPEPQPVPEPELTPDPES